MTLALFIYTWDLSIDFPQYPSILFMTCFLSKLCKLAFTLTLKTPRKPAPENVVCLCCLLNIRANFSNLFLHTGIYSVDLFLEEQSDLGPHCLQK